MLPVLPEVAEAFKPTGPVFLGYPLGTTAGRPDDRVNQRVIRTAALESCWVTPDKWRIVDLPFPISLPTGAQAAGTTCGSPVPCRFAKFTSRVAEHIRAQDLLQD